MNFTTFSFPQVNDLEDAIEQLKAATAVAAEAADADLASNAARVSLFLQNTCFYLQPM